MKQLSILLILVVLLFACGEGEETETLILSPGKSVLLLPASNTTCNQGAIISATESTVALSWNSSANTETYEVSIKNLITGVTIMKPSTTTQLSVNLNQNTPYSWYVISKSSKTTVTGKSEVWKFYNAGTATSSYAPFPAELTLPTDGQTVNAVAGKTVLDWNGSDVDGDIVGYDVYLGTTVTNMAVIKTNLTESIANDVEVTSATTYYWKVVSKDSKGNSSTSEVYWFKTI